MSTRPDFALLYDRDCGFCTRMLDRIVRLDRRGRLRAVTIQGEEGARLLASVPEQRRLDSWHLVGPDGEVASGGAAAAPLARLLPGAAPAAAAFATFPALTDRAYRWVAAHRDLLGRFLVLLLALSVAVPLAGCGSTVQEGTELTVYLSAPTSGPGPEADAGRDLVAGAELALDQAGGEAGGAPVRLVPLDSATTTTTDGDSMQSRVAANARTATEDSISIAYIGEEDSAATRISVPITNVAGLLQVAPGPTAEDLLRKPGSSNPPDDVQTTGNRTLVALAPVQGGGAGAPSPRAQVDSGFRSDFEAANPDLGAPGPEAAYGYEAMALILDSIDRAADPLDRGLVINEALATSGRDSILGTYSIDSGGAAAFSPGS